MKIRFNSFNEFGGSKGLIHFQAGIKIVTYFKQNLAVAKPKLIWLSTPLWSIFAYYTVI
jgi:hypothetical protein